MTIKPKLNHGKPVWRISYSLLGKYHRKFFRRNPALGRRCPGYTKALRFMDELAMTFGEAKIFQCMSQPERAMMVQLWQKIKEMGITVNRCIEIVMAHLSKRILLSDAVNLFLQELRVLGASNRYQRTIKSNLSQFCAMNPGKRVDEITIQDIQLWRDAGDYRPASRRTRLTDIKTFFKFATIIKWTSENPCIGVKAPKVILGLPGILTPKQAAKLMRVAFNRDRAMCPWLALALFCGLRPEELRKITWENIRLNEGLVEVAAEMAKTATRRVVVIPANAIDWLKTGGGLPLINAAKRFSRLRRQAGLFLGWSHDAMRHSAATYLYALTEDANHVAKQMGHTVDMLLRNYNSIRTRNGQLVTKELAEKFFNIRPELPVLESGEKE